MSETVRQRAERIHPAGQFDGMDDAELIAVAVAAVRGPGAVDGVSADAVEALFDHLADYASRRDLDRQATASRRRVN